MPACVECGATLAAAALSCSGCGRLTRSADLETLAQQARTATAAGDLASALTFWTQALELLPQDTAQYRSVWARIDQLRDQLQSAAAPQESAPSQNWKKGAAGLGPALLLLLSKGKLLLLGLTKLSTLLSMFAFFGVYWSLYGWSFALGLVLSIYVHEMGHVLMLRHYGIPATAPMFIPGFGALIRTRAVMNPIQDSRVGLAGPIYGLGAAVFSLVCAGALASKPWAAIAHATAVMNLFNMIPVWQLDGSRGLHSLTKPQRAALLATAVAVWALSSLQMLFLVAIGLVYRLFTKDAASEPDSVGLIQFAGLLVALTTVAVLAQRI